MKIITIILLFVALTVFSQMKKGYISQISVEVTEYCEIRSF